jgi:multidrug efflux pump subunit AcrA (membrane-fusion protein)
MSSSSSRPDLSSLKIDDHARHRGGLGKILAFISAGGGLVLIVAGLVFALRTHKPVVEVMAARKAQAGEAATLLNASGYVTPRRRATIAAKITARVTAVYAEEGRHVHEGDILARLDDSDAQMRLASARANREAAQAAIQDLQVQLTLAERELHRAEEL